MAQKRRGLGRGLQALIPETQAETPSARPTDVFFPDSQEEATAKNAEATDDQTSDEASQAGGGQRTSDDIAATLLAPSKRTKKSPSKSSAAKGTSRRSSAAKENSDSSASASKKKASTRSKPSKTARSVHVKHRRRMTPRRSRSGERNLPRLLPNRRRYLLTSR